MKNILEKEVPEFIEKLKEQGVYMTSGIESLIRETMVFVYGKGWLNGYKKEP